MDVNQIAVAIRPRNHWEAIDLGFRLARQHWRGLYGASLAVYLPVVGVIFLIFGPESLWTFFIIRWLKPVFDRVPLIVLSRAVFASTPGVGGGVAWFTVGAALRCVCVVVVATV